MCVFLLSMCIWFHIYINVCIPVIQLYVDRCLISVSSATFSFCSCDSSSYCGLFCDVAISTGNCADPWKNKKQIDNVVNGEASVLFTLSTGQYCDSIYHKR